MMLSIAIDAENKITDLPAEKVACRMNQAEFRGFYLKMAPKLRAYICRSCGSYDLAEDIMQDAFLKFLRTAPSAMDELAMKGYLYRTADSLLVDHWRRSKRRQRWSLETMFRKKPVVDRRKDKDMTDAFRELKPQQRSILWMAYVEEFNHREIAQASGVKEKSVKVLLFRARKALAAILGDDYA